MTDVYFHHGAKSFARRRLEERIVNGYAYMCSEVQQNVT